MSTSGPPPILIITGPTASGKTAVAIELAKRLNGEIISADSMQVYRQLSIGTAKPNPSELQGIPYHLIDHVSPDEQYTLGRFIREADAKIKEISGRNALPIVCGGTGLYIRGLIYGVLDQADIPHCARQQIIREYEEHGLAHLYNELEQVDPISARRYGPNDRQRIMRALEVYRSTGKPLSESHVQDFSQPRYPFQAFILTPQRPILYNRINARVDTMVSAGLLDEVHAYLKAGWSRHNPAVKALGYQELIDVRESGSDLTAALQTMKQKSRNYAKRQETWFRRMPDAIRIDNTVASAPQTADSILSALNSTIINLSA